jgi:hypothetical protein
MPRTRLTITVLLFTLVFAPVAMADITMKVTITMTGPMPMTMPSTIYVKGMKMRTDVSAMGQDMSMLVDAAAKQQLMLNHGTKQVTTLDPKAAMANMPVTVGEVTTTVKPNGQTKEMLGRSCRGYQVLITMPMTMGSDTVTMTMSGVAWLAPEGAGVGEYKAFYKAAAAAGLSASPLGQGMQSKGMDEVYKELAEAGMPMLQELQMAFDGAGQLAGALSQMAMTISMTVTEVSTETVPDDRFAIPAGYTKQ